MDLEAEGGQDIPERAQQPVIDDFKEACHGSGSVVGPATAESMAMAFLLACLAVQSLQATAGGSMTRTLVEFEDGWRTGQRNAGALPLLS